MGGVAHDSPAAVFPIINERGGDVLRQNLRCMACGRREAALQHPGCGGEGRSLRPWRTTLRGNEMRDFETGRPLFQAFGTKELRAYFGSLERASLSPSPGRALSKLSPLRRAFFSPRASGERERPG